MLPTYDLDKIKFTTDGATFERAVGLYENGKITHFKDDDGMYSAVVIGTKSYNVWVSAKHYDRGNCTCYLGQTDILCKHMVAVAIRAVMGGVPLTADDKKLVSRVSCSGRLGVLSAEELAAVKKFITAAKKHIKPYNGPSRVWFAYQDSLTEGCHRLAKIISELPVSAQTAGVLVQLLLRLDRSLAIGGVDDSDGTVGNFMTDVVEVLQEFAKLDDACKKAFAKLQGLNTCFGWEEPLIS